MTPDPPGGDLERVDEAAIEGGPVDPWGHLSRWDRQPGEPPAAFAHFDAYLHLGRTRTVKAVAAQRRRSSHHLYALSREWQWISRASAYDAFLDQQLRDELTEQRAAITRRHLQASSVLLDKAMSRLEALDPNRIRAADLPKFIELAVKVQRLALGESTENTAHVDAGGVAQLADLTPAERADRIDEVQRELAKRAEQTREATAGG